MEWNDVGPEQENFDFHHKEDTLYQSSVEYDEPVWENILVQQDLCHEEWVQIQEEEVDMPNSVVIVEMLLILLDHYKQKMKDLYTSINKTKQNKTNKQTKQNETKQKN